MVDKQGIWQRLLVEPGGTMDDLIYIAAMVVFFFLALAYVRGCEKLE